MRHFEHHVELHNQFSHKSLKFEAHGHLFDCRGTEHNSKLHLDHIRDGCVAIKGEWKVVVFFYHTMTSNRILLWCTVVANTMSTSMLISVWVIDCSSHIIRSIKILSWYHIYFSIACYHKFVFFVIARVAYYFHPIVF